MANQILLKRSNVVDASGNPKLPEASAMSYGEIAVNYASGAETLSIKNSNDEIVTFSSDNRSGGGSVSPKYSYGVFIQATDGTLYKTEEWDGTKTPNAIAVLNSYVKILLSLVRGEDKNQIAYDKSIFRIIKWINQVDYQLNINGMLNTYRMYKVDTSYDSAVKYCWEYVFPDGVTHGYLPSVGEWYCILCNYLEINDALTKCNGELINSNSIYWTSSFVRMNTSAPVDSYYNYVIYDNDVLTPYEISVTSAYARPIAKFPFY